MKPDTITVSGSHGDLIVDAKTGTIIDARTWDGSWHDGLPLRGEYAAIVFFDPARFTQAALQSGSADILGTAYATRGGGYVREMVWGSTGSCGPDGKDFHEWLEFPLLPAPSE